MKMSRYFVVQPIAGFSADVRTCGQFFSLSGALLKRVEFPCLYTVQFRPLTTEAAAAAAEAQKELITKLTVYKAGEAPLAPGAEAASKMGNPSSTGRSLSALSQSRGVRKYGRFLKQGA